MQTKIILLGSTAMNAILTNADVISKIEENGEIEINKLNLYSIVSFLKHTLTTRPKKFRILKMIG